MKKKSEHDELTDRVNVLIDYMKERGFTFLLVAGKDGTCARHMMGTASDLEGMLFGLAKKNKQVAAIMRNIAKDIKTGSRTVYITRKKGHDTRNRH